MAAIIEQAIRFENLLPALAEEFPEIELWDLAVHTGAAENHPSEASGKLVGIPEIREALAELLDIVEVSTQDRILLDLGFRI